MNIELKYGKTITKATIPENFDVNIINANLPNNEITFEEEQKKLEYAINNPIGSDRLKDIAKKGKTAAIMVSDITRPSPSKKLLPYIIAELKEAGIKNENITIIFGMGIHRSHTKEEQEMLLGSEIYGSIKAIDSNKDEYVYIGDTKRATPVYLCKTLVNADIKICTGNIEYHYFAGYSGGAKAVMPGAANYKSISNNHKLQLDDRAKSGKIQDNPVREDIDEVGKLLNIDFILNVVLNKDKKILKAFSGDYILAHRQGCEFLDSIYNVKLKERADIVIVSPGGYPKDVNLYQTQKSLDNAKHAIKDGGIIILVAQCKEGFGEKVFEQWIKDAQSPEELIDKLRKEFVLGGHKAAAIGQVVKNNSVFIVTDLKDEDAKKVFFKPYKTLQSALDAAIKQSKNPKILIIPQGSSILPSAE